MPHFNLTTEKKEQLTVLLYKYMIYHLKKLKNDKFNNFALKKWDLYKESKFYLTIHKEVTSDLELVEKEYIQYLKHKDIKILR
jgi:hypothetical protein